MGRVKGIVDKVRPESFYARRHETHKFFFGPEPKVFERGPWTVYQYPRIGTTEPFAVVSHKSQPDKPVVSVPTDKLGNIPRDVAILRFMTEEEGDRKGRKRSVLIDLGIEADKKAKLRAKTDDERLAQYLWYMTPNESDLAKIDTPDADWKPPKVKRRPFAR